jgi:hypothetical protein
LFGPPLGVVILSPTRNFTFPSSGTELSTMRRWGQIFRVASVNSDRRASEKSWSARIEGAAPPSTT